MKPTPMRRRAALAFLLVVLALPVPALAELMLNPTRIVFAKNQRAAQVELINNSGEPATYRISMVNRRMSETGEFIMVSEPGPGDMFADAMLSYSPRQVTLQPGTTQVVRLMVRKSDGLAEGEYRSHLHFEKLPEPGDVASSVEPGARTGQQIGVVLKTLIGVSIPVIVRHGASSATVALGQLKLLPGEPGQAPQLAFVIERAGNSSVYGDLSVTFSAHGLPAQQLAKAGGVAVYTPNPLRRSALALQLPPGLKLAGGQLQLSYRERAEDGGKLLAEAALALP